jgi:CheY-like chemotaxis protein
MRADSPPAAVYADRVRLRQVLINLLSNSIKYNRPGGTVTIDWELTHHGRLRLDIMDTGVGIASEDLQLLFQPFSRLYLSQSSVEGSGIGLALSKQLVELMHGKIAVRSTIGVGSTFSVELPCARHCLECNQLLDCSERLTENASPKLPSILFIRNSSERTACIRAELEERYQIRVWEAHSGAEGLRLATQQRPDLIVTDLNLPDMTATQFLRQWRSAHPGNGTPVIAVCDGISPFEMNRSGNEGFYAFLPSPLEITSIAHLLPAARR